MANDFNIFEYISDVQESREGKACLAVGNQASATITAKRSDLSQNWHPSGFYTPEQVEEIIDVVGKMAGGAVTVADAAIAELSGLPSDQLMREVRGERTGLEGEVAKAATFMTAVQAVRDNGSGVIDAPGLKSWVLAVLARTDSTITTAAYNSCLKPWWASLYQGFAWLLNAAWGAVKAIAGVIAQVGEFVASVPDTLGQFKTLLKWTVILGGGALAILFIRRELISRNLVPSALPESWQLPD